MRPRAEDGSFVRRWQFDETEAARLYVEEHRPVEAVAKMMETSPHALYRHFRAKGITRKTNTRPGYVPHNKAGRYVRRGYVLVLAPENAMANSRGYVPEHRLIMAEILGRPLLPCEVVHHLNHDSLDNRPENLALLASQAEHARLHGAK